MATDAPKTVVAPTIPPTHDHEYNPDHPGPVGRLLHALHMRLIELEIELGLRAKPVPPAPTPPVVAPAPVTPPVVTPTAPATTAPATA